jgi:hypothetical protein
VEDRAPPSPGLRKLPHELGLNPPMSPAETCLQDRPKPAQEFGRNLPTLVRQNHDKIKALQPQPLRARANEAFGEAAVVGVVVEEKQGAQAKPLQSPDAPANGAASPEDLSVTLVWPSTLSHAHRASAAKWLAKVPPEQAQEILDEIAGVAQRTPIANAIGLVRKLVQLALEGNFVAEHAPNIARLRQKREVEQNMQQTQTPMVALLNPDALAEEIANFRRARDLLRAKRAGGGQ